MKILDSKDKNEIKTAFSFLLDSIGDEDYFNLLRIILLGGKLSLKLEAVKIIWDRMVEFPKPKFAEVFNGINDKNIVSMLFEIGDESENHRHSLIKRLNDEKTTSYSHDSYLFKSILYAGGLTKMIEYLKKVATTEKTKGHAIHTILSYELLKFSAEKNLNIKQLTKIIPYTRCTYFHEAAVIYEKLEKSSTVWVSMSELKKIKKLVRQQPQ